MGEVSYTFRRTRGCKTNNCISLRGCSPRQPVGFQDSDNSRLKLVEPLSPQPKTTAHRFPKAILRVGNPWPIHLHLHAFQRFHKTNAIPRNAQLGTVSSQAQLIKVYLRASLRCTVVVVPVWRFVPLLTNHHHSNFIIFVAGLDFVWQCDLSHRQVAFTSHVLSHLTRDPED